jgi:hypothetical protein
MNKNSSMELQFKMNRNNLWYSSHLDNRRNLNKVTYAKNCPNLLDQLKANMFCIQTRGIIHPTNIIMHKFNSTMTVVFFPTTIEHPRAETFHEESTRQITKVGGGS